MGVELDGDAMDDDDDDDDDDLWDGWGEEPGASADPGVAPPATGGVGAEAAAGNGNPSDAAKGDVFSPPHHLPMLRGRAVDDRGESFSGHLQQPQPRAAQAAPPLQTVASEGELGNEGEAPEAPVVGRARSVTLDEAPQECVDALIMVFTKSQRQCAKLWLPRRITPESYKRVKEYNEVAKKWERKKDVRVRVFQELFLWRDRVAREEDESPEYIIDNRSLLTAAKLLPTTLVDTLKVSCPLSPFFSAASDAAADPRSPAGAALAHVDRLEEMIELIQVTSGGPPGANGAAKPKAAPAAALPAPEAKSRASPLRRGIVQSAQEVKSVPPPSGSPEPESFSGGDAGSPSPLAMQLGMGVAVVATVAAIVFMVGRRR
uniref:HRDC domain-containing protein n=1 Tax=Phaeomonas parva TaxID=124430 RepID=A0A6U4D024_9STRA|mmetsp:Transcript_15702/g.47824  ORF Transcript_15702/g.47824 Transcript_15702/m.47824 type:complete len:375 (+) Transcript_15702:1-1125(+)